MNAASPAFERLGAGNEARLDALFEAQAHATPDAVAVIHRGSQLSYAELHARIGALAGRLRELGVGPGVIVAVGMERTPRMVAALLAVLTAGGAYLPLDPAYPTDRLDFMLADSRAGLMLTDCGLHERLRFGGLVFDPAAGDVVRTGPEPQSRAPQALAYVIYTSGTTGRPKGVMLGHTATHLVDWARTTFADGQLARMAATTSISFDPSILEIFLPLCTGGTVVLKENALEPFARDERPTMLDCVPSALIELCRAGAVPDSVRVINIGGEPLKAALVREVYRRTRVEAVYNHYGPTEATTCATVARVGRETVAEPTIGRPIAGAEIRLLDSAGAPVDAGERGEICIGGAGLALGYLDRPELTAERFVESPWGRLYRTGDLGLWTGDGELEFAGRADGQVKIRGHRVELSEVEAALARLPGVRQAAAITRPDPSGRLQIVGYVQTDAPLSLREARSRLEAWLPAPMLPARLVTLEAFPLTLSGKVDRKALPDPAAAPVPAAAPLGVECRVEEAVAEVFKDVLGVPRVGRDDSFFDLGGDSLSGVNAALRLGEILGRELPSAMIHQAPTPRSLAEALKRCPARQAEHLSVLHPGGTGAPLFCVADLFGRPFSYLSLSRRLGAERPVLGLSPGPLEASFTADGDIGALSRAFAVAMRRSHPDGPCVVAGYSAGGVLAFDLARTLELAGAPVALVLLDCSMRSRPPSAAALARWTLRQALDVMDPAAFRTRAARIGAMGGKLAQSLARPDRPPEWIPDGAAALAGRLMSACARYRPDAFHGPTLLLKSADRDRVDALLDHDGLLGWRHALKGPVECAWVPGDHHAFMREPYVAETAAQIGRFLAGCRSV